jgi:coenzyme F420-dependent glucose-6-phosphate dehydrogenase
VAGRRRGRGVINLISPVGYVLAGEEHPAPDLIRYGTRAEEVGFSFLFVSDHFHPWNHQQGHASSVWPVLGSLCSNTSRALLISAVTCPILRFHMTTLAQAAATVQTLSEGRFVLGLGTGENLNEHIAGRGWPGFSERLDRLEEAVEFLRHLLTGEEVSRKGRYFTVERAQLFNAPASMPVALAASGPRAAATAGRLGDALISLGDDPSTVEQFLTAGGQGKPKWTQISVCWANDLAEARRTAHRLWPVVALDDKLFAHLETPADFEKACAPITEEDVAAAIVCGPDPLRYRAAINACLAAGFDGVALHQIGPDQEGFFDFWQRELKPYYGA